MKCRIISILKGTKKFFQENLTIGVITIISITVCAVSSFLKSSKTHNVPDWLYPWGELLYWISISIIAATIFFIFQTYIPAQKAEYLNRPAVAITFRKLQLMLVRLDNLVIEPYKKVKNVTKIDMDVDSFFNPEFLKGIFNDFDLSQESPCAYDFSGNHMSFKAYLISQWEEVRSFAKDALLTPYAQTDPELSYQLEFLLSESSFDKVFKFLQKGYSVDYSHILGLSQPATEICKNNFENIVALHKIAFSLYDILRDDKRLKNIYRPLFYREEI